MDNTGSKSKRRRTSADGGVVAVRDGNTQQEIAGLSKQLHTVQGTEQPRSRLSRSLFVRSLPPTVSTETLTQHFSQSYPLKHATVVLDPTTKKSKGYGFVTFVDAEDAQKAKVEFNGSILEGSKLKVEIAEARQRDLNADRIDGHKKSQPSAKALKFKADRERQILEEQKSTKLIVRNLPWSIKDSEQLASLFRSYGKVKYATIPKPRTGLSAGFGFVTLRGRENAERALAGVNGKTVDGRTLAVDWAVEKEVWETLQKDNEDKVTSGPERPTGNNHVNYDSSIKTESDDESLQFEDVPQSDADDADLSDEDESETSDADTKLDVSQRPILENSTTLFIRNLPFSSTDETLQTLFSSFGVVRYARVVADLATARSKGTGFVCFYNPQDTLSCLRGAPKLQPTPATKDSTRKRNGTTPLMKHSLLEDMQADPSGRYTVDGRVLHVSRAVDRNEANRLVIEGNSLRDSRDKDKRRFYLLSEGTVPSDSPLYDSLAPSEIKMREDSAKQRQSLMKTNPSLHLSLTRLSIRNIPRSITSRDLKALAREAVVGFAKDVKAGSRARLSREELSRGDDEMREGEKARKSKGKGIVRQAKIVCEGREGGKVSEDSGAGRSRGYGFIEYVSHRWALMGLRWLNGRAVGQPRGPDEAARSVNERKKRLIVEFAIENAQVVARRQDREAKARESSKKVGMAQEEKGELSQKGKKVLSRDSLMAKSRKGMKRQRENEMDMGPNPVGNPSTAVLGGQAAERSEGAEKLVRRQQIIGRKRMTRKLKRRGADG